MTSSPEYLANKDSEAGSDPTTSVDRFLDRELSWLAFNQRVLELSEDDRLPVLERAKFLAIFASNLDEFFMVRVAGLKRRIATGIAVRAANGHTPREVLEDIWERAHAMQREQAQVFHSDVLPGLLAAGIELLRWQDLTENERTEMDSFFDAQVFPVLTPLAVDPSHPFPYISGLSLNLAVVVRNPVSGTELFARVKVPPSLPRFVKVAPQRFVPLEDVIGAHLDDLFPGMQILQNHSFRVTRNEDVEVEEDDAENLLLALERELMRRRFGPPVRLEVEQSMDPHVLELLMSELDVNEHEVFRIPGPLDLTGLWDLYSLDRDDLKLRKYVSKTSRQLAGVESSSAPDVLACIRERDILLHHPYDSFSTSVQLFLEQAAIDPNVLAIKQTLYRTSGDSPIVDALITAAQEGKQVLAIVEIKARFDEENNIAWSRKLEEAGVHVVYGLVGLKTHSKISMVVRNDGDQLRRYCHIGTGNYHPKTARLYEDFGLLTRSTTVGDDVANLFNVLSGYSMNTQYDRLLVAPHSVRSGLLDRIDREIEHQAQGRPARIRFKVNALVDERVVDALYRASRAGVPVEVWVRGICSLRPGVPGLSENIRVISILGRFLEHSRCYGFDNGGIPELWIGSADMMHRNLDRRVEALVLLRDPGHVAEINTLFDLAFDAGTSAWDLHSDGSWTRRTRSDDGTTLLDFQETLIAGNLGAP
ncbi:MAG: RNA degradosome polyphosphate kinase [Actinobacteria bacterium]|uniref:ATP-polyphosphate phosphotransferase n=1 Tax=freshwater metagenome TaxID=449393 RepID=A0A6J6U371_9ZZZZ|nr:RNA degradosome polyphosphate kinase [Actinomycetota bacterium]